MKNQQKAIKMRTCIQLGLLPLAKHLLLNEDVMVNAITGSTGAGVKPGATSLSLIHI